MKNLNIFFLLSFLFLFQINSFSQGGQLDPSYNFGEIVFIGVDNTNFGAWGGGDIQSDEKTIAYISTNSGSTIAKISEDGSGYEFLVETDKYGRTLKVLNDNSFLLGTSIGLIEKYDVDGSIDTTFDNSEHFDMFIYGLAIQDDDKILAAGRRQGTEWNDILARYNSDGSIDDTFGNNGEVIINNYVSDWGRSIQVLSDGSLLFQGTSFFDEPRTAYFFKLNSDGSTDNTFGDDGFLSLTAVSEENISYSSNELSDGKILVVGTLFENITDRVNFLAKLNPDGSMDDTFGDNGVVLDSTFNSGSEESFSTENSIILNDGKILAYGSYKGEISNNALSFGLKRYHEDGSLDTGFGDNGLAFAMHGSSDLVSFSATINADGDIFQIGNARFSNSTSDIVMTKYLCCMDVGTLNFGLRKQSILIYPNPIEASTTLSFSLENEKQLDILLTDVNGQLIKTVFSNQNFNAGEHQLNIDIPNSLASGVYF